MEPAKFHDVLKATLLLDIAPVRFHGKVFRGVNLSQPWKPCYEPNDFPSADSQAFLSALRRTVSREMGPCLIPQKD